MKRRPDTWTMRLVGRYVLDRAENYDPSSGIHDALCTLGAAILTGDVEDRYTHGELEDEDLIRREKEILSHAPKKR
jgi:hypothetical protein